LYLFYNEVCAFMYEYRVGNNMLSIKCFDYSIEDAFSWVLDRKLDLVCTLNFK